MMATSFNLHLEVFSAHKTSIFEYYRSVCISFVARAHTYTHTPNSEIGLTAFHNILLQYEDQ